MIIDRPLGTNETIRSSNSRIFEVAAGQNYDLRADDCNYNELSIEWDVDVSGGYT
ncbi:MAG: hypothetical protein JW963_15065 [Anaerolineales bacterium]|nr:hypothetical protein [Anaerolineales bacterium]